MYTTLCTLYTFNNIYWQSGRQPELYWLHGVCVANLNGLSTCIIENFDFVSPKIVFAVPALRLWSLVSQLGYWEEYLK